MRYVKTSLPVLFWLVAGLGCDPGVEVRDIPEWQGEAFHFDAVGTLNAEPLDFSGADAVMELSCEREYIVPEVDGVPLYEDGQLIEIKINGSVTIAGVRRLIELELKMHDFQSDPIGTQVAIVPRSATADPGPTEMWLEWEWHDEADETTYEGAAQTGTFTLEHFTGSPDETGLVIPAGEGAVGGHWSARWSETEELVGSFTVPCIDSDVEFIAM